MLTPAGSLSSCASNASTPLVPCGEDADTADRTAFV